MAKIISLMGSMFSTLLTVSVLLANEVELMVAVGKKNAGSDSDGMLALTSKIDSSPR